MTVEPVRTNGRTRRVSAPPLTVIPPEVSPDWDRWRGTVTTQLAGLVDDVALIRDWMLGQREADARAAGIAESRRGITSFIAPNLGALLMVLIQLGTIMGVLYIAVTGH